jgi:diguanylate cyclase (GGDEF)-like protein
MPFFDSECRVLVDREITRLEGSAFHWLSLSPELEQRFEETTAAVRARRMWVEALLCLILYNSFLFTDFLLLRNRFMHSLVVRLLIVTPLAWIALRHLRRSPSERGREAIILFVCGLFSVSTLSLYFDVGAVVSAYALTDLMLIVLFTNVGLRLRLPYALFASGFSLLLGVGYLYVDPWLGHPEKVESLAVLISGSLLSIVANYSIERGERLNFLLRLQTEMQSEDLAAANHHLRQISNEDRLTRISNRRHFDEIYKIVWDQSAARGCAMSLLMIDIDNFKLLNDRYGHTYGDSVLRRVATLLGEALRARGDFVARYGGEEFVVVLPNSSLEAARLVAERIRKLIEIAGSPATDPDPSSNHGWSTVSCGVATAWPQPNLHRGVLIALADEALYRAKAEGRNRVCCAPERPASALIADKRLARTIASSTTTERVAAR